MPLGKVTHELELLKLRLRDTGADQIELAETQAMAQEISAIRLQLKRLRFDQDAMSRAVHEANASISGGTTREGEASRRTIEHSCPGEHGGPQCGGG